MSDPAHFLPIVYTPTVGEACLQFGHIMRRPKGLYVSIKRKGRVREFRNWPQRDVRFIVVTSGQRILGLGDLGANGMGIPIGKLALYTACAGVPPQFTLPLLMDCGTNNEELAARSALPWTSPTRPEIAELDEFVDEFVAAVQEVFPNAVSSSRIGLELTRCVCSPGIATGSAVQRRHARHCGGCLGRMPGALRISRGKLSDQTFLFLGAGSAGVGIADLLVQAMMLGGAFCRGRRARDLAFRR